MGPLHTAELSALRKSPIRSAHSTLSPYHLLHNSWDAMILGSELGRLDLSNSIIYIDKYAPKIFHHAVESRSVAAGCSTSIKIYTLVR
jgi:hypothetical protein